MGIDHHTLAVVAETSGLLLVIAMSIAVMIDTFRPRKRQDFDRAAEAILHDEDRPWR